MSVRVRTKQYGFINIVTVMPSSLVTVHVVVVTVVVVEW
jgi:hypothetical protein